MSNLISVDGLRALLDADARPALLDVRWRLDAPDGRSAFVAGHLPGAVYVDLDDELADRTRDGEGRHPLPSLPALQAAARRWGLDDGADVVAYDDAGGVAAARAWWLLRRAGVRVRVLDGGLRAWTAAGGPLHAGDVVVRPGSITLRAADSGALSIDDAADWPRRGVLLDVRASERYRGDAEPLDPVAGHIPGAVNAPAGALLTETRTLRDAAQLRAHFAGLGVVEGTPVAAYCGSGIAATHTVLALAEAGIEADVFPGSWSQWSRTPGRPVAIGDHPDAERRAAAVGASA